MICPNLYTTGKKARLMSNALEEIDIIGKLKDHPADEKRSFDLKMKLRQVRIRDQAQITHLAESR